MTRCTAPERRRLPLCRSMLLALAAADVEAVTALVGAHVVPMDRERVLREKQGVMLRGRWLDRAQMDQLLRELETK